MRDGPTRSVRIVSTHSPLMRLGGTVPDLIVSQPMNEMRLGGLTFVLIDSTQMPVTLESVAIGYASRLTPNSAALNVELVHGLPSGFASYTQAEAPYEVVEDTSVELA